MTLKEQLLQALENAPEDRLQAILNFALAIKNEPTVELADIADITDAAPHPVDAGRLPVGHSLLDLFDTITADITAEERTQLPTDGAEQHDHYIYGTPKRSA